MSFDGPDILPPPRRQSVTWWPVVTFVVAVLALGFASTVKLSYYAIAPGGAFAVEPLVHVNDGPAYKPEGKILLCTVSLKRTTAVEALQGWLDPTIDVVKERVIVPPEVGRKKLREFNLQQMDLSKQQALAVAFEELGYDVVRGKGAQVLDVVDDTPAKRILRKGEVIQAVDGEVTNLDSDAVRLLGSHRPGDTVELTIRNRAGTATRTEKVTLTTNPDKKGKAFLGVRLQTYRPSFDFPYDVDIESERIGGPSAGLAFTLEVLDVLTEGELTGGRVVAATGTMELDGSVGQIGGVAQKTVAVEEAGAEVFLVPKGEEQDARKVAGKRLRIEPVRNLDDALRILAGLGGNGLALDRAGGA
jgi:PDZ domain-containing protein